MGNEFVGFGFPPIPRWRRIRRARRERERDGLRGGELRCGARADVFIPDNFSPDAVGHDVGQAVAIPIGDAENRIAPLRLCRALDRAVRAGLFADELATGAEIAWGRPARGRAAEVFDERDVARAIAGDEILVAIAVPIDGVGRGEGAEFHIGSELTEIARRQKLRHAVDSLARVFDEGHAAIFVAADDVQETIAVKINRRRRDHAQIHFDRDTCAHERASRRVDRFHARAGVFVEGEAVAEFSADQVELSGAAEIAPHRRRHAERIDIFAAGLQAHGRGVNGFLRRARVADNVDVAAELAAGPLALGIERALAAVERTKVAPEIDAHRHVERAVAVEVDELPLVLPDVAGFGEDFFRDAELLWFAELRFEKVWEDVAAVVVDFAARGFGGRRRGHDGFTRDVGNADRRRGFPDEHGGLEDRELELRVHLPAILKKPGAVVRLVGADDDEVHEAVAVVVHRQRPRPQPHAEIGEEAGIVVREPRHGALGGAQRGTPSAGEREDR